jgi:L-alanine-DL-glutamate epimerase-like enolase superfamily enzyme
MRLEHEILTLRTTHPYTIARGGAREWRVVWVRLIDDDGTEGWGEAAPSRFYGESADSVVSSLRGFAPLLERADPWAIDTIELELERALRFNAAAKVAVSAALHDLAGKRLGVPLYKMWGLDPARAPQSSFTIGIGDKAELKRKVKDAAEYPVLKVKLGTDRDAEIIRTVREAAPSALLRIDANAAWTARQALQMMDVLVECGVEFVEQPLPPHDIAGLRFVRERAPLPIIADESCLTNTDIPKLVGAVDGINIKLAKCASLREALRMVGTARAHGLRVMMGCMVESSLGIAAASHLAPLLDYADLDGAALLANDPFVGPSIAGGSIAIPTTPGLGVSRA